MVKPHDLTQAGAEALDHQDPLRRLRDRFHLPDAGPGARPAIYLAGNSLGLQVKTARSFVERRLYEWEHLGVDGWHDTDWMSIDHSLAASMARLVGARHEEVAVGGTLTANLHTLMASFYRPRGQRSKILMEASPFPSDRYAAAGQARWHGLDPDEVVVTASATGDEGGLLGLLDQEGEQVALVLLAGINYYSGQLYDMETIVSRARKAGCTVGLDLAHAAGNVPLKLHDWGVDFAAWCGYKYLNGGPGSPAAFFVHERHHNTSHPRLAGWWGHEEESRFAMPAGFLPETGAAGWKISTPPVLGMAPLEASLVVFDEVGLPALVAKSSKLTGYLESLLNSRLSNSVEVITPILRGAQLSLRIRGGRRVFRRLQDANVLCDWREPDVIRVAPAPLYNTFLEMVQFVDRLEAALQGANQASSM